MIITYKDYEYVSPTMRAVTPTKSPIHRALAMAKLKYRRRESLGLNKKLPTNIRQAIVEALTENNYKAYQRKLLNLLRRNY